MLRFCTSYEEASLLTHLFAISVKKNDKTNEITVHQLFPKGEDQDLIQKVKLFAYPPSSSLESRCSFHFVVGDIATGFRIGFAQYETVCSGKCVISDYYYPRIFNSLMSLPDNQMITAAEQLSLKKRREKVVFRDENGENTIFSLDGKSEEMRILNILFKTFSPFDITKIIIGMLQAKHIFVVASNVSVCTEFAGLTLLIKPFKWSLNIVPILPDSLSDMLEVPIPILIGTTKSEVLYGPGVSIASHVCVNPDAKIVYESSNYEEDPETFVKILKLQIEFHNKVSSFLKSWSGCSNFPTKDLTNMTQEFIRSYLQVYGGNFNSKNDFIQSIQGFPQFLSNSQIIQDFINYKCDKNGNDPFNTFLKINQPSTETKTLPISTRLTNTVQIINVKTIKKSKPKKPEKGPTKSPSFNDGRQLGGTLKLNRHLSSTNLFTPKLSIKPAETTVKTTTKPITPIKPAPPKAAPSKVEPIKPAPSKTKTTVSLQVSKAAPPQNKTPTNPVPLNKNKYQLPQIKIQIPQFQKKSSDEHTSKAKDNTTPQNSEKKHTFNFFKNKSPENPQTNQEKSNSASSLNNCKQNNSSTQANPISKSNSADIKYNSSSNNKFRNSVHVQPSKSALFQERLAFYNNNQN